MLRLLSFSACFSVMLTASSNAEPKYQSICFELHHDGNFLSKAIHEVLGTEESKAILQGVCGAFTAEAERCVDSIESAGAGQLNFTKKGDSDYYGAIKASPRHQICRAFFVTNDWSSTSDTDANMQIATDRRSLTWYAAVVSNPSSGKWVRYQLVFEEVPENTDLPSDCHIPGLLWETHDKERVARQDNVTVTLDRQDAWCTGQHDENWRREFMSR